MLVYPQLGTGALSQFPIRKERRTRTVINATADGRSIKLADPAAVTTEWQLDYAELTDSEAGAIEAFFAAAEGTLNGFTFLDPAGNLLAWSGQLDDAVWVCEPLLSLVSGEPDPVGGMLAWRLTNTGAGPQTITQTLASPGDYVYCLSVYARAQANTGVTALIGNGRMAQSVTTGWNRITFTGTGGAGAESVQFGLEIPAGATVDVYGPQAEPQEGASIYRASTLGGVYTDARLRDDELAITSTGVNRHSCTVNIINVNHL
ncbi:MAG: hypothetical protein ABSF25_23455 [Bryobacteraceae bacterium]|jgi:hypothetical protein